MATWSTKIEFSKYFNVVKRQILDYAKLQLINPSNHAALIWLEKVLDYNVPHGKLKRGLLLVETYRNLNEKNPNVADDLSGVCKLGWAIELLQSSFLVADDLMDNSLTRRGRPCWYKLPEIGVKAVNDCLLLENCVDFIIYDELREKTSCFNKISKAFHEAKFATILGQNLDSQKVSLSEFTQSRYSDIVRLKTSHYTFLLPVLVAVHLSTVDEKLVNENELKELCFQLGHYFQAQDDFLDCYGDPEVTGKIGTDIEDGKCSWLVVEAVKCLNPGHPDFLELEKNYGQSGQENVAIVKNFYSQLKLDEKYNEFEKKCFETIDNSIDSLSFVALKDHFRNILLDLHKRKK